jgi:hypothetical protein
MSQIIEGIRNEDLAGLFGKFIQNIPSMMHDSVGNVAESLGAEEIAASRRKDAAEKRISGAPDIGPEDFMKIAKLAGETATLPLLPIKKAAEGAAEAIEFAPKIPESLHYTMADMLSTSRPDIAAERMKDAERLRARRLGKDATIEEAIEQRISEVDGGVGASEPKKVAKKNAKKVAKKAASNEGMAGALKAEAARQASNEGMAGALKSEAARQASPPEKAKEPVTRGDLDPDMQDMMGTTGVDPDDYDLAGGAEEPEVDYTQQAVDLFKTVHATEYDPKSSMDKGKLEKMKSMLAKQGGLGDMSANQFALQVYRNS